MVRCNTYFYFYASHISYCNNETLLNSFYIYQSNLQKKTKKPAIHSLDHPVYTIQTTDASQVHTLQISCEKHENKRLDSNEKNLCS